MYCVWDEWKFASLFRANEMISACGDTENIHTMGIKFLSVHDGSSCHDELLLPLTLCIAPAVFL